MFGEGLRPADASAVVEAGAEEVFDHGLSCGHVFDGSSSVGGGLLESGEGATDAGVFAFDDGVDAGVFDDGEEVVCESSVFELVEEAFHVGVDLRGVVVGVGVGGCGWCGAVGGVVVGEVGEELRGVFCR